MATNQTLMRMLGRSGIEVSALGLGCWAIGGSGGAGEGWHGVNDEESIRAIHAGLAMGVNFLDTANVYGKGHSERLIAKAVEGKRDQVVIASKFAFTWDEETMESTAPDTTPEGIRKSLEGSLTRLNTDYLDLFLFHYNDFPADQAEPVRDTLDTLVKEGKIRSYGWSTDFTDRAAYFAEKENCVAIEVEMNVVDRNPEMIALCEKHNLAAINRGPLAMGLLTGKYTADSTLPENDVRGPSAPDWMKYFINGRPNPEWLARINAVREILTSDGRTLAQGAIAWLWAHSEQTIPIPGFKNVKQVEDNAGALEKGALNADQMAEIDRLLA